MAVIDLDAPRSAGRPPQPPRRRARGWLLLVAVLPVFALTGERPEPEMAYVDEICARTGSPGGAGKLLSIDSETGEVTVTFTCKRPTGRGRTS